LFILRFFISVLFCYSGKSTKKWQKMGGQKAKYSVKGGFSAENPPFYGSMLGTSIV